VASTVFVVIVPPPVPLTRTECFNCSFLPLSFGSSGGRRVATKIKSARCSLDPGSGRDRLSSPSFPPLEETIHFLLFESPNLDAIDYEVVRALENSFYTNTVTFPIRSLFFWERSSHCLYGRKEPDEHNDESLHG
jgi:hypothetical protein